MTETEVALIDLVRETPTSPAVLLISEGGREWTRKIILRNSQLRKLAAKAPAMALNGYITSDTTKPRNGKRVAG